MWRRGEEDVWEARGSWPGLERAPAAPDDRLCELAPDVVAALALDLVADDALAAIGFRHARHPRDAGEGFRGVGAEGIDLHVHRGRAAETIDEVGRRVDRHDLPLGDDDHALARLRHFRQNMRAH